MNIQTVSQRFRSVQCFVREVFKENVLLTGYVWTPCLCPSEGHKYGDQRLTKTHVIEFAIKSLESSSEGS